MTNDNEQDNEQDSFEKPEMTEQGFVAGSEYPACPEWGYQGEPVLPYKPESGLQGLHCEECGRVLSLIQPATVAINDEDQHYAAIGDGHWGTGETREEAVENMKEFMDEDCDRMYGLWTSNRELSVSKYGTVSAGEGPKVILTYSGRRRIRGDLNEE